MKYIESHLHSDGSLLDGLVEIKEYVKFGKEKELPALFISDHGNISNAIGFYAECKKNNIKPIIGIECYLNETGLKTEELQEKLKDLKEQAKLKLDNTEINQEIKRLSGNRHLILYAKNYNGYKNLCKLISEANLDENFYYKARINYDMLEKYHEDLICTSACVGSDVNQAILDNDLERAEKLIKWYKKLFGDDFYIEVQNHNPEIPEDQESKAYELYLMEKIVNTRLIQFATNLNIKTLITNDTHYLYKNQAFVQELLLCKSTNINDPNRFRFPNNEFYYKTYEEILELFKDQGQEFVDTCIKNTYEIIDKCDLEIPIGVPIMPKFPVPEGETQESYFKKKVVEGIKKRFSGKITTEIKNRINYEASVIHKMGFEGYFLIVQDYINFARENDIPVGPGRGSASGSMIAFILGITDIDPIRHNLLFERFLNPDRISLPDIDTDFCVEKRDQVVQYLKEKYGEFSVCNIITLNCFKAKAAIKTIGKSLGYEYGHVEALTKVMGEKPTITIESELKDNTEFKSLYENDEDYAKIIDLAKQIEGRKQASGVHAAGVIITDIDIRDVCPLVRGKEGVVTTAFSMEDAEKLGLVKYDLLGLKNLTIINNALKFIKNPIEQILFGEGLGFDFSKLNFDDKKTYQLLQNGYTNGIFQLESHGMQGILTKLRPTELKHIDAVVALYRPGPIKCGAVKNYVDNKLNESNLKYEYPQLEPILAVTYNTLVYQEQIMKICTDLAGYTMSEADEIRKAMGKKKKEIIEQHKETFINGCVNQGVDKTYAENLYESIVGFAEYCFNRAHSLSYSVISYYTAFLKANYPTEYMCCLLNHEYGGKDFPMYLNECFKMGVKILPPDINMSSDKFTIDKGGNIRFGFLAIKDMGESVVEPLLQERKNGDFTSFWNIIERVPKANKTALEALIKIGALNSIEENPKNLLKFTELLQKGKVSAKYKKGEIDLKQATCEYIAKTNAKKREDYQWLEEQKKSIKSAKASEKALKEEIIEKIEAIINEEIANLEIEDCESFTDEEKKNHEEELMGFSISFHPPILFSAYEKYFEHTPIPELTDDVCETLKDQEPFNIIGVVKKKTVLPSDMAFVDIEYMGIKRSVKFPPWIWQDVDGRKIKKDALVLVKVKVLDAWNTNFGLYDLEGQRINVLNFINDKDNKIYFDLNGKNKEYFDRLKSILTDISLQCYNNNKLIQYIPVFKIKDIEKISPSCMWIDDKKELMKELYLKGISN